MSTKNENRLGGLIQTKGTARRPADMPQRGEPAPPPIHPTPIEAIQPAPVPKEDRKPPRSLTLKLDEDQYQRLRTYGFKNEMSHQRIIEKALLKFLDEEGA